MSEEPIAQFEATSTLGVVLSYDEPLLRSSPPAPRSAEETAPTYP